jgi:hypothetical protein
LSSERRLAAAELHVSARATGPPADAALLLLLLLLLPAAKSGI